MRLVGLTMINGRIIYLHLLNIFLLIFVGHLDVTSVRLKVNGHGLSKAFVIGGECQLENVIDRILARELLVEHHVQDTTSYRVHVKFRWKSASTPSISASETFLRRIIL